MNNVGRMLRCDRCSLEEFEKYVGTDTRDGGFTKIDRHSPAEGWVNKWINDKSVDLCPGCAAEYTKIETRHKEEWELFLHGEKERRVAE